jgi:uncharacterized membrane protein
MVLFTIAIVTVLVLAYRVFALERKTNDLQSRLADLTQRLSMLEGARGEPAPAPEPGSIPAETPARTRQDWETLVGTNWLNRLGAVVLVIGIALFLGYSLTQLGPAGKIAIGFAAGISLLLGGIVLEKRPEYRSYSYSLMGAGWAVVYFSTFAMHGLPAARVMESAAAGVAALILVSAGMIFHAVRYHSEAATALAYLLGFIGLNVTPVTPFAVVATLTLAISLVAIAYAFGWFRLPLLGVVLTYLSFTLRYDPGIYGQSGLLNGQAALWIYWTAFESFDLLDLRRRRDRRPLGRTLLPLNFCGFAGASMLHEWSVHAANWWAFFGMASVAYLVSALLRARWAEPMAPERLPTAGGSELAATASAGLMAAALVERFSGTSTTLALLLEGELVVLAGLALGSVWIGRLGAALLVLPVIRLLFVDAFSPGTLTVAGATLAHWTPVGMMVAGVLAANRVWLPRAWYFAVAAAAVAAALITEEFPRLWVAPVVAFGALALLGSRRPDLMWTSLPGLLFAAGSAVMVNTGDGDILTTALVVAALYAGQRLWMLPAPSVPPALSILGTALLTLLVYEKATGRLLTVSLGIEGGALLAAGFLLQDRTFRLSGLTLFLLCIGKLFIHDLRELDTGSRILSFIVLGVMLMAASWLYNRFRDKLGRLM